MLVVFFAKAADVSRAMCLSPVWGTQGGAQEEIRDAEHAVQKEDGNP